MNREAIYNALLALLQGISGFHSVSRVFRPHTDYPPQMLPALCLDEDTEAPADPELGLPTVYTLRCDVWLYFTTPQNSQAPGRETNLPQTPLNNALDALANALKPPPFQEGVTLGGLVKWVRIEGEIRKVIGLPNGNSLFAIAKVPLVIRYVGPA